ncbi:hypothetical protein Tco_1029307 [Tanacetum coccineum]|uniref:Integrase, catalytic region, zinc finger, CCHC-type, peptidase aspartic, catalytic n=1 Tax=Tanacetum coccineum TaxID=301880 RepID=A0ABQ5G323_9ASTR
MANLSEDIQCAGFDTRPPMLDRTDFKSWQQRIRLYCRGKENGPEQPRVYSDLSPEDKEMYNADIRGTNILLQEMQLNSKFVNNMLPEWGRFQHEAHDNENKMMLDQFTQHTVDPLALMSNGRQNKGQGNARGASVAGYGGAQNRVGNANPGQTRQDLALNVDNVFQADDYDAFDSDVDEAPTAHTMFMANLSSADSVYDEAGPSYGSDILSEVHDHDHYQDAVCEHHEEHEMHDDVQANYVVDSHDNYTSVSNMIPYDQYVKDNAVPVVQSNVSSVPHDAYMMIFNGMHEPHAQSVSEITRNTIVDNSLTAELATYKEQVELYERRAMFELTEREQKIDE